MSARTLSVHVRLAPLTGLFVWHYTTGMLWAFFFPLVALAAPSDMPFEPGSAAAMSFERDTQRLDVVDQQRVELAETGSYVQVLRGGGRPDGEERVNSLFATLKPNFEVHVYDAPCGKGWQLIEWLGVYYDTPTGKVEGSRSVGYGCEAKERTWLW